MKDWGKIEKGTLNILHWMRAINRIPKDWIKEIKNWIMENEESEKIRKENNDKIFIRTRKGYIEAANMTQKIIRQNLIDRLKREESRYRDDLAIQYGTTAMEWERIDKRVLTHSIAARSRSFMYRFNNGLTYNNKDFNRFGYKETDECSFCKEEKQSSKHLFVECKETRKYWEKLNNSIKGKPINEREIFLGNNDGEDWIKETAKNSLISFALQFIYKCNYKGINLSIVGLWENIKYIRKIEEEIAGKRNKIICHITKWESIDNLMKSAFLISGENPEKEEEP